MTTSDDQPKEDDETVSAILGAYWKAYGGWRALRESLFLHISLGLTILTANFWINDRWWEQPLSVLPNLLGFTLGGFAIFLAFGDEKFRAVICGQDPDDGGEASPYMEVSATFLHFVLVQLLALVAAIISSATNFILPEPFVPISNFLNSVRIIWDAFGYWLFLYGICSAGAAALAIFSVASWYDRHAGMNR